MDGLTSEMKEPTCYYYNGGRYPVSLIISDGFCQKTIKDTSLYISESSLRKFDVPMALENELMGIDGNDPYVKIPFINVFPTLVTNIVNVSSTDKSEHNAILVDELGRKLMIVSFNGLVQISMDNYISGTYFIVVDNQEKFKIIKK